MKFTVYFEIFGKKMRTIIEATSEEDAKYQVMGKIKWHKFEKQSDDMFEHLKDIMGIK